MRPRLHALIFLRGWLMRYDEPRFDQRARPRAPGIASGIVALPGESADAMLRRFKKVTQRAGILSDAVRHECFESRSVRRRRKSAAARKRRAKAG